MRNETRFRMVEKLNPERFKMLLERAQRSTEQRFAVYEQLAKLTVPQTGAIPDPEAPAAPKN